MKERIIELGKRFPSAGGLLDRVGRALATRLADRRSVAKVQTRREHPPRISATLEQRYEVVDRAELADEVFLRLRRCLIRAVERYERHTGRALFREMGRIAPSRLYFYLKSPGEKGWLMERSGSGWIVSRAEKIIHQNLFLRDDEVIDQVLLYAARDRVVFPRVRSARWGGELLAFAVYEQKLLQQFGLELNLRATSS